jgi:hypothetical protein
VADGTIRHHPLVHAAGLYGQLPGVVRHPLRTVLAELRHLHELEGKGETAVTPLLTVATVVLLLLPLLLAIGGGAVAAYYLTR